MRDRFICPYFSLDLSSIQVSYVEENPRFKDSFFTKYSFPFTIYMNTDIRMKIGHYDELSAVDLKKKYEGFHIVDGKMKEAVLEILSVQGNQLQVQIDSGFEELPNFNKKLAELPFGKIYVNNIYDHAEEVCKKSYPDTNYNFPAIIYDKHSPDEKGWEVFNQFINDRDSNGFVDNNEDGADWYSTPENERTVADKLHKNRNIIHPMPYVLHVLKLGFSDAGYQLVGDILKDSDFMQKVVFSSSVNYTSQPPVQSQKVKFKHDDYDTAYSVKKHPEYTFARYTYSFELTPGSYLFQGTANFMAFPYFKTYARVYLDDKEIFLREYFKDNTQTISFEFFSISENASLRIVLWTFIYTNKKEDIANFQISKIDSIQITNRNEFSLGEFVPDMTFGEFVRIIKNWKNYDIEINGSTVVMDLLSTSVTGSMKDISQFSVPYPTKTFISKRSFNIVFPEMNGKFDNAFISEYGVQIGGTSKEETTEIQIAGYCLPVRKHRGHTTAYIASEESSILGLVHYDGLTEGENLSRNSVGLMLPNILSTLLPWYRQRITSDEYNWSFYVNKNQWRHINIKDTLYLYGRKAWIRDINKTAIDSKTYHIELRVETIT